MRKLIRLAGRYSKSLVVFGIVISLFYLTRLPALSVNERNAIASRFHFTRQALPQLAKSTSHRDLRTVHPSLERHAAWISAVGASVALNDLDSDGLANDVCYVETRSDQVVVAPVPGTGERYSPFQLTASTSIHKPNTVAPMGCLPGDLNEDGLMDILVYYWGRTPVAFLQKKGLMTPVSKAQSLVKTHSTLITAQSFVPREMLASTERWYTNAATFADLDGDGHSDLIIGNYFQDNARILDPKATGVEFMQHSMTRAFNGGHNRLLRWQAATSGNQPTVTFQDVADVLDEEVKQGWTLAVGAADLDGDLLPEIYFANDFGPDRLLHNRSQPGEFRFARLEGQKGLTTPNSKVLGHDSFKGMGVDFGDINHDGWLDMFVSNIAAEFSLEESHFLFASTGQVEKMQKGIAPYVDRSEPLGLSRSGWGWETKFGDFDNDGELEALQATGFRQGDINRWPELHELAMGNDDMLRHADSWFELQAGDDLSGHQHNPFFVKATDGRYYDLASELGIAYPEVTRGIATADVDGDGDLDFAVANQWGESFFYRNDNQHSGDFLVLKLLKNSFLAETLNQASKSQVEAVLASPAIGTQATVSLPDGRQLVSQVDGGNGHSGARSTELHFGLGKIPEDVSLAVDLQWRDAAGEIHQESLLVSPGWHTVLLGDSAKLASSIS